MAGIYLHIPFCKQACTYCNFHFSTSLKMKDDLLRALIEEIRMSKEVLADEKVETVYFGGGTPSLLSADELNRIFDALQETFSIENLKEVTLETNPDDLSTAYVKSLRSTPVNRFSIGVQSFREEDLRYMNRAHNAQEADAAIKRAQDAGFTNLSIDLIYGTPGLTDVAWKENLDKLKELSIPHFSSYALTVEEGTVLHRNILKNKTAPVDAAQSAGQFGVLMERVAEMGYDHYEISNFALPGMYAIHNTSYWQGKQYLGLGPSAHSFDGKRTRSWNVANNPIYIKLILEEKKIPRESEHLTDMQRLNEYIMTSLRTMWGCSLVYVARHWGDNAAKDLKISAQEFMDKGQMIIKDEALLLTNDGKFFADHIAGELFRDEERANDKSR